MQLLRNEVFVDLYQIVSHGLRIGEDSYSIKTVERLYRPKRATDVATAAESIVQYARWIESRQPRDWKTAASSRASATTTRTTANPRPSCCSGCGKSPAKTRSPRRTRRSPRPRRRRRYYRPEVVARLETAENLRQQGDAISVVLADLIDFHRREEKPMWWRMFDRAAAMPDELRDDAGCIEGVQAVGSPAPEKQSLVQTYRFDPAQECKLAAGGKHGPDVHSQSGRQVHAGGTGCVAQAVLAPQDWREGIERQIWRRVSCTRFAASL